MSADQQGTAAALPYSALVERAHYVDPQLAPVLAEVWAQVTPTGHGWSHELPDRKSWEVAMALRALRDHGALGADSEILGVGAGTESTLFVLTRHVARVFATDLYFDPQGWGHTAQSAMLIDPGRFYFGTWDPQRLVVQHMDALDLRYPDESFGGVFSSSSIEHFGGHEQVARSMDEIFRVLKPGGVLSVSTELLLDGPGPGLPGILMFTPEELVSVVVGDRDWDLIGGAEAIGVPGDLAERDIVEFSEAVSDIENHRPFWSSYPHLILRAEGRTWTSVHLTLVKR